MNEQKRALEYLYEYFNEEVINAVTSINGSSMKTLESILYYYTGYTSFDQVYNED